MTPLEQYDDFMEDANHLRRRGESLVADADAIKDTAERMLGLEHFEVGPGVTAWVIKGVDGIYFATPREAVEALTRGQK